MRDSGVWLIAATLLVLAGCNGEISGPEQNSGEDAGTDMSMNPDDGPPTTPSVSPASFVCDETLDPGERDVRRLSHLQYHNTVEALATRYIGDPVVVDTLSSFASRQPGDSAAPGLWVAGTAFENLDESTTQTHVNNYYDLALMFARESTSTPERLEMLAGTCATDGDTSNDAQCIEDFIQDFGLHTMRRPLTSDELSFFRDTVFSDGGTSTDLTAGYHDVVAVLLNAPQFLYHYEDQGADIDARDDFFELDAYARAARLSFHFWQSMPDEALFAAAADGSLMTDAGYEAQVNRLFDDPKTRTALETFFFQWLRMEEAPMPHLLANTPRYQAFAGGFTPTEGLQDEMIDEVIGMMLHYAYDTDGSLDDTLLNDRSFARGSELAGLYGVAPWSGDVGDPIVFGDAERRGLLTRAALVASTETTTSPIHKGVFIRRNLLCDTLPPPLDNVPTDPMLTPPFSRREFTAALTEGTDSCRACHTLINGLGYVTENFDALGRIRSEEEYFLEDGTSLGVVPIDIVAQPHILGEDDDREVNNVEELSDLLLESGKVHACLARHYFRFAHGRPENITEDGCALERLRQTIIDGGSLRDMLVEVALDDSFKQRRRGTTTAP